MNEARTVNIEKARRTAVALRQADLDSLDIAFDGQPAPGETIEVAPGVHWPRMPLPAALDHSIDMASARGLEPMARSSSILTGDHKEGIRAVREKRPPEYTGRQGERQ